MKESRSQRVKDSAAVGALGGGISSLLGGGAPNLAKFLIRSGLGAGLGAASQYVGDAVTGDPEGGMGQLGSGIVGGALVGAPAGFIEMGSKKGSGALARWLAQTYKMSPKAAALSLLAGGALGGALGRGVGQGVDSGILEAFRD